MSHTLRRILSLWRPHKWLALGLGVALVLRTLFTVVLALSIKLIIDRVVDGGGSTSSTGIVALLIGGYLVSATAAVAAGYLAARAAAAILADVRTAVFDHLQRLSIAYHTTTRPGDVLAHFSTDVAELMQGAVVKPTKALQSLLALALFLPVMVALEWRLAMFALVAMPLAVVLANRTTPDPASALDSEKEYIADVIEEVNENLAAQPVIRAYGLHRRSAGRFSERIERLRRGSITAGFRVGLLAATAEFAVSFVQLVTVGAGAVLALNGELEAGALAAFVGLLTEFTWETTVIGSDVLPTIAKAGSGIRRIDQLLATGPVTEEAVEALRPPPIAHSIRFEDVDFAYDGTDELQLVGVNLELPTNAMIAIVGPSGSGKSTLLALLLRFYDPAAGKVLVDSVDLQSVDLAAYRAQLGVVFQDTFLFNETLRENIRLARPDATDTEISAAVEQAGLDEVVGRLPHGLDTVVGPGGRRLSGGQRQRVGIARAVLRRPPLLLLDEVTSALDPATEQSVSSTIRELAHGRTVVSVTHRLQTVTEAGMIVVMQDGQPIEQGTFAELQAAGGVFQAMWKKQAGFEISLDGRAGNISPERLRAIPLFADVAEGTLATLSAEFASDHFDTEENVFQQGEPADRFHIIARGVVEVIKATDDGEEVLAHLEDGDFFGEMAMLNDAPRNATVRAVTPTLTLSLNRAQFEALLATSPATAETVRQVATFRSHDGSDLSG